MAEAFKELINAEVMRQVGHHLQRVWPAFPRQHFEDQALQGLGGLAFKARAQQLAQALGTTLPSDFHAAADVLEASLKRIGAPRHDHDPDQELGTLRTDETGLAGWPLWGLGEYIATHGLAHPDRALRALHALTQRFTAEFAIRPFWVHHPELTLRTLHTWVRDPSAHVRRLVSEGSRPRLPWGLRLQPLVADPTPMLPLLSLLQDDPSEYVRRSVANHLNDIAKDHPQLLLHWLKTHLPEAPKTRQRLLRHACRTLIKQGHPGVMAVWGLGQPFHGQATLALDNTQVHVGGVLGLSVTLASTAAQPQTLEIDLRVHYRKADGSLAPKVFKGQQITLEAGGTWPWRKKLSFRPVTTRTLYPGPHRLEVQINGQVVAGSPFELLG